MYLFRVFKIRFPIFNETISPLSFKGKFKMQFLLDTYTHIYNLDWYYLSICIFFSSLIWCYVRYMATVRVGNLTALLASILPILVLYFLGFTTIELLHPKPRTYDYVRTLALIQIIQYVVAYTLNRTTKNNISRRLYFMEVYVFGVVNMLWITVVTLLSMGESRHHQFRLYALMSEMQSNHFNRSILLPWLMFYNVMFDINHRIITAPDFRNDEEMLFYKSKLIVPGLTIGRARSDADYHRLLDVFMQSHGNIYEDMVFNVEGNRQNEGDDDNRIT